MTCPLPRYFHCHAVIALAIMAAVMAAGWVFGHVLPGVAALSGFGFYAGREVMDWWGPKGDERLANGQTRFDWPGLVWPTAAVTVAYAITIMITCW